MCLKMFEEHKEGRRELTMNFGKVAASLSYLDVLSSYKWQRQYLKSHDFSTLCLRRWFRFPVI